MNQTEVVSSSTHYEEDNLVLEYDKGDITLYDLPAGKKEAEEAALPGMMREFREETGLSMLDIESITGLRPYTYEIGDETSFQVYPFDIELVEKRNPEGLDVDEHDGYTWLGPDRVEQAGRDGWLNSPKFLTVRYAEAARNGLGEELRGEGSAEDIVFTDEQVMENLDSLEALIKSKLS